MSPRSLSPENNPGETLATAPPPPLPCYLPPRCRPSGPPTKPRGHKDSGSGAFPYLACGGPRNQDDSVTACGGVWAADRSVCEHWQVATLAQLCTGRSGGWC